MMCSRRSRAITPGNAPINAEAIAYNRLFEYSVKKEVVAPMSINAHAEPKRKLIIKPSGFLVSLINYCKYRSLSDHHLKLLHQQGKHM